MGKEVWCASKPAAENGVKILGTPLGQTDYVHGFIDQRIRTEKRLLAAIEEMEDPQCAWLMLLFSANPRANHMIRMLPPSLSVGYAEKHDKLIWQSLCTISEAHDLREDSLARNIAFTLGRPIGFEFRIENANASSLGVVGGGFTRGAQQNTQDRRHVAEQFG